VDTLEAIRARRSVKKLRAPGPSAAEVAELLELAATAPDHGGLSPWRFTVLSGPALESFPLDAGSSPTVVVVGVEPQGDKIPVEEQAAATAAASQLLLLAADAMGYGAMWRTGSAAYDRAVASAAGLSEKGRIVAFIHLGTPDDGTDAARPVDTPRAVATRTSSAPAAVTTATTATTTAAPPTASRSTAPAPTTAGDLGIGSLRDR
jgi:nitroreductase